MHAGAVGASGGRALAQRRSTSSGVVARELQVSGLRCEYRVMPPPDADTGAGLAVVIPVRDRAGLLQRVVDGVIAHTDPAYG